MKSFIVARMCSAFYNYTMSKRIVFKSDEEGYHSIVKYVFLAIILLISSMALTQSLIGCGISTMHAKLIAECLLFLFQFLYSEVFCVP